MGYKMQNGRWADTQEIKLNPLEGTLTVDGKSAVVEVGERAVLRLRLLTTSVSTGDTLDMTIETSADGVTYRTVTPLGLAAAQVTDAGGAPLDQRLIYLVDRFVRANFDVGGSGVAIVTTLTGEAC